MKIKIEYKYGVGSRHPYQAFTHLGDNYLIGVSASSFEEAKADLIKDAKDIIEKIPMITPEPEEVEL